LQRTFSARRFSPGRRGLTLVEVLVAVVILSFALLAYLTVIQVSNAGLSDGNEFTIASQAAGNQVAQDRGLGYSGLTAGTTTTAVPGLSQGQMTTTIGPMDGNSANRSIMQVDITITWSPRKTGSLSQTTSLTRSALISAH
jgi:prepilin-type N-terminal cleavage/methylation domain-containing protein